MRLTCFSAKPCAGRFEGNWHGVMTPDFSGTMVGQGKDGCTGIIVKADFQPVNSGNNFVQAATGTFHYPYGRE